MVIVDEAHATGMYGARGSGRVEELGLRDRVAATMHTGGKALGSGGAWVAGSRALRDVMVNRARVVHFLDGAAAGPGRGAWRRARPRRARAGAAARGAPQVVVAETRACRSWVRCGGESMIVPIIAGCERGGDGAAGRLWWRPASTCARSGRRRCRAGTARLRVTVRYPVSDDDLLRFASAIAPLTKNVKIGSDPYVPTLTIFGAGMRSMCGIRLRRCANTSRPSRLSWCALKATTS